MKIKLLMLNTDVQSSREVQFLEQFVPVLFDPVYGELIVENRTV
jgi:hypothetical protein